MLSIWSARCATTTRVAVYLDTSVLVSAFIEDDHSERSAAFLVRTPHVVVSRWAEAEFSSALGLRKRRGVLDDASRLRVEATFDGWLADKPRCRLDDEDVARCRRLIRDGVRLRTPDALHLALLLRHGYRLATLDRDLTAAARELGVEVITP